MNIPLTDFYRFENGELVTETTKDVFLGKRTVLFMVPGAFTPTCSEKQLPEFEAAYDDITAKGIDQVICMAINDDYVMQAWGKSLGIEKVRLIGDGNGHFSIGVKAAVDKSNLGFGARAWRLALVLNENGMVEWAGVEEGKRDNATDDLYVDSTPARVLEALDQIAAAKAQAAAAETQALLDATES